MPKIIVYTVSPSETQGDVTQALSLIESLDKAGIQEAELVTFMSGEYSDAHYQKIEYKMQQKLGDRYALHPAGLDLEQYPIPEDTDLVILYPTPHFMPPAFYQQIAEKGLRVCVGTELHFDKTYNRRRGLSYPTGLVEIRTGFGENRQGVTFEDPSVSYSLLELGLDEQPWLEGQPIQASNDLALRELLFEDQIPHTSLSVAQYQQNHALYQGYRASREADIPKECVIDDMGFIQSCLYDAGSTVKTIDIVYNFKDPYLMRSLRLLFEDYNVEVDSIQGGKTNKRILNPDGIDPSKKTLRLIDPYPVSQKTMQTLLAESNSLCLATGDSSFMNALVRGKLPQYHLVAHKKQLITAVIDEIETVLGKDCPLALYYKMQIQQPIPKPPKRRLMNAYGLFASPQTMIASSVDLIYFHHNHKQALEKQAARFAEHIKLHYDFQARFPVIFEQLLGSERDWIAAHHLEFEAIKVQDALALIRRYPEQQTSILRALQQNERFKQNLLDFRKMDFTCIPKFLAIISAEKQFTISDFVPSCDTEQAYYQLLRERSQLSPKSTQQYHEVSDILENNFHHTRDDMIAVYQFLDQVLGYSRGDIENVFNGRMMTSFSNWQPWTDILNEPTDKHLKVITFLLERDILVSPSGDNQSATHTFLRSLSEDANERAIQCYLENIPDKYYSLSDLVQTIIAFEHGPPAFLKFVSQFEAHFSRVLKSYDNKPLSDYEYSRLDTALRTLAESEHSDVFKGFQKQMTDFHAAVEKHRPAVAAAQEPRKGPRTL